jgi:hypothetical protein
MQAKETHGEHAVQASNKITYKLWVGRRIQMLSEQRVIQEELLSAEFLTFTRRVEVGHKEAQRRP